MTTKKKKAKDWRTETEKLRFKDYLHFKIGSVLESAHSDKIIRVEIKKDGLHISNVKVKS